MSAREPIMASRSSAGGRVAAVGKLIKEAQARDVNGDDLVRFGWGSRTEALTGPSFMILLKDLCCQRAQRSLERNCDHVSHSLTNVMAS